MTKYLRAGLCWALWGAGDVASRLQFGEGSEKLYRVYNWLMVRSMVVQGDGPGPWFPKDELIYDRWEHEQAVSNLSDVENLRNNAAL